jgi:hypothetical protein
VAQGFDLVPPTVAPAAGRNVLSPPRGSIVDVLLAPNATDNFTPPAALVKTIAVFSNEGNGPLPFTPDGIFGPKPPPTPSTLLLRAERAVTGTGRVYLVLVSATDLNLNTAFGCGAVIVPLQMTVSSVTALMLQAATAAAACATAGAPPPGYANVIVPVQPLP